jgi:exodeoxyribonuclease VII large subunit
MHFVDPANPQTRQIFSVTRLNQEVRLLLENAFPLIWVEGEISNLARPASGHIYFSLKDAAAQVRCAMFRNRNQLLRFAPKNGEQVLVRARVSLFPARGEFQLTIEHMEPAGAGALQQAFEALKQRLQQEGLFAEEHKRPLPMLPRRIGVITSPTGAAIHDVLTVLRRRCPSLPVLIYPVPVQGEGAAEKIADMIRLASARREVDALLLTRGGGSLEDLWAFNEEIVARAIAECELPLVCAVGHEVDVTIADFVADRRAPTPSAAAELLSPDATVWLAQFVRQEQRLGTLMQQTLRRFSERRDWLEQRLLQQHPRRRLQDRTQRLDELELRLATVMRSRMRHARVRYNHILQRFRPCSPKARLQALEHARAEIERRLWAAIRQELRGRRQQLTGLVRALDAVSPLATLARGYAIVRRADDATVLHDAASVAPGAHVVARLARGRLHCRVETVDPAEEL